MSRRVQLVLLCEDQQQETFIRRFLANTRWSRKPRVVIAPPGYGSAEQFVRTQFPAELLEYRRNRHRVTLALIVMIDGDQKGVNGRLNELNEACRSAGIAFRRPDERIAIFIPTWRIETWLAYLNGTDVDEGKNDYPRLSRPRDCQPQVDRLYEMCQEGALRQPSPPSLDAACDEYQTRLHTPDE
jgi:hypothetical protein